MRAHSGLAVRAAAAAALVSAGLAGCTAVASGQAPGPPASTRDAGGPASGTSQDPPVTVYVIADGAVVAIRAATGTPGRVIPAGNGSDAIAVTPDGKTAYAVNSNNSGPDVIPIRVATDTPGPPIKIGKPINPIASGCATETIAITPDGKTAYVTSYNSGTVVPISTATGTAGPPIRTGTDPFDIAITPGGETVYVSNKGSGTVTPIDTATNTPDTPIRARPGPGPIVIAQ
jgi:YVTN family beta-propeller protein